MPDWRCSLSITRNTGDGAPAPRAPRELPSSLGPRADASAATPSALASRRETDLAAHAYPRRVERGHRRRDAELEGDGATAAPLRLRAWRGGRRQGITVRARRARGLGRSPWRPRSSSAKKPIGTARIVVISATCDQPRRVVISAWFMPISITPWARRGHARRLAARLRLRQRGARRPSASLSWPR